MQSVATVKNLSMAESGTIERPPSTKTPSVRLKSLVTDRPDLKGATEINNLMQKTFDTNSTVP